ncbi:hypothetical protein [Streptomyces sp. NBC_00474]|uniref:hypothetical protein n=1 Tax=Streptomyces sp. NBC_00474 TaxID=2975754 RepID=UPI00225858A3|nr:hypothetical protein [Streptomyces sp. NBC_00474]MCX5054205.1 hypothetical protein [Streptomyces sp. NBC_00474]
MPSSNTISPSSFTSSFAASHCASDIPLHLLLAPQPAARSPQYRFIACAAVAVPCPSK